MMGLFKVTRTWYVDANDPVMAIEAAKPGGHVDVSSESVTRQPHLLKSERAMRLSREEGRVVHPQEMELP